MLGVLLRARPTAGRRGAAGAAGAAGAVQVCVRPVAGLCWKLPRLVTISLSLLGVCQNGVVVVVVASSSVGRRAEVRVRRELRAEAQYSAAYSVPWSPLHSSVNSFTISFTLRLFTRSLRRDTDTESPKLKLSFRISLRSG